MKTLLINNLIYSLVASMLLLCGFSVQAKITETTYSYDENSNRTGEIQTIDGAVVKNLSYTYNQNNQLMSRPSVQWRFFIK